MELTLIIARHAKSDWHSGAVTDHERPLNARGLREAPLLGAALSEDRLVPTLILASDARRTEETALLLEPCFNEPKLTYLHALYLGDLAAIQNAVIQHAGAHRCVMVLGHNPGFSLAAGLLSTKSVELKTANAAVLRTQQSDFETAFLNRDFTLTGVYEGR